VSFLASLSAGNLPGEEATPAALVQAALEAELHGPSPARQQLLEQALRRDPDFAPARWQSGFVRWDNKWLTVDEVADRARANKQLAAYRKFRGGVAETADGHRQLAEWCHKYRLPAEARVHWAKVLEFEPTDPQALDGLGLQLYRGQLIPKRTKAQINVQRKQVEHQHRLEKEWQPKLARWRRAIEDGDPQGLNEARRGLRELADPAVLPMLGKAFATPGGPDKPDKSAELTRLIIDTADPMDSPDATRALVGYAIHAADEENRAAAADALKKRPMHAYVPLLIEALPDTMKTHFELFMMADGTVIGRQEILVEGRDANRVFSYTRPLNVPDIAAQARLARATPDNAQREYERVVEEQTRQAVQDARRIEQNAKTANSSNRYLRERIEFVVKRTTGFEKLDDPLLWEKQYNDYYGWSTPAQQSKPTIYYSPEVSQSYAQSMTHSCFVAGTPVITVLGPQPIETIQTGDRVLSQDPATGELAYKAVQRTTLRPPTPLTAVTTGPQTIQATPGHPFWVVGKGWQTAKFLKVGDAIHGLNGATPIDRVEELPAVEVYNLVVADWHTYFAGQANLLVHDNSPLQEQSAKVPGLIVDSTTKHSLSAR
jgi:hypothetical protein